MRDAGAGRRAFEGGAVGPAGGRDNGHLQRQALGAFVVRGRERGIVVAGVCASEVDRMQLMLPLRMKTLNVAVARYAAAPLVERSTVARDGAPFSGSCWGRSSRRPSPPPALAVPSLLAIHLSPPSLRLPARPSPLRLPRTLGPAHSLQGRPDLRSDSVRRCDQVAARRRGRAAERDHQRHDGEHSLRAPAGECVGAGRPDQRRSLTCRRSIAGAAAELFRRRRGLRRGRVCTSVGFRLGQDSGMGTATVEGICR